MTPINLNGTFADPAFHGLLVADQPRCDAYRAALLAAIKPGDAVLDIGAGSGVLSLLACQAGARRVYAVERTPIIKLAGKLAQLNGYADRITFIEGDLTAIELPEPVNVVVSELMSQGIFGQQMERLTAYARDRFLAPKGRMIPERVVFSAVPVEAEQTRSRSWPPAQALALDFTPLVAAIANQLMPIKLSKQRQLADAQEVYTVDARSDDGIARFSANRSFEIASSGSLSGVGVWFDADLGGGVQLGNRDDNISWANVLFPLQEAVAVEPGMRLEFALNGYEPVAGAPQFEWGFKIWKQGDTGRAFYSAKQSTVAAAWLVK